MRDRFFYVSMRCSKSNNNYLKFYDPKQESEHIMYLDSNNLYGYAMSRFFLMCGFKWIDPIEFELKKYTNNSSKFCVLEAAPEYPKELRELHSDYPLAAD